MDALQTVGFAYVMLAVVVFSVAFFGGALYAAHLGLTTAKRFYKAGKELDKAAWDEVRRVRAEDEALRRMTDPI